MTDAQFEDHLERGAFVLHWHANGHRYGIGTEILEWMGNGATVVVNGSREHLPEVRRKFPRVEVVHVAAPAPVLETRLAARGREDGDQAAKRFARNSSAFSKVEAPALEIVNDGALEPAAGRLLHFLTAEEPRP